MVREARCEGWCGDRPTADMMQPARARLTRLQKGAALCDGGLCDEDDDREGECAQHTHLHARATVSVR
jgi:hypothetical protein